MPTIPVESWNDRTRFACFAGLRKWALFGERLEGYLDGLFEEFAGGTRKVEGMWGESASLGRIIDHLGSDINNIVDNLNWITIYFRPFWQQPISEKCLITWILWCKSATLYPGWVSNMKKIIFLIITPLYSLWILLYSSYFDRCTRGRRPQTPPTSTNTNRPSSKKSKRPCNSKKWTRSSHLKEPSIKEMITHPRR